MCVVGCERAEISRDRRCVITDSCEGWCVSCWQSPVVVVVVVVVVHGSTQREGGSWVPGVRRDTRVLWWYWVHTRWTLRHSASTNTLSQVFHSPAHWNWWPPVCNLARLVLRRVTVSGFNSLCWTFISVCNQPATQGQLSLPSLRGR